MRSGSEPDSVSGLVSPVNIVLLLESVCVACLSFWFGKEYVNNVYLREYVQSVGWTYLPVIAFALTFAVAVGVSEAYAMVKGPAGVGLEPLKPASPGLGFQRRSSLGKGHGLPGFSGTTGTALTSSRGADSGLSESGPSFAEVFSEWRPPVLLKHVEPAEPQMDPYAPKPFPVIRRLEPAVEPVEEERPRVTPRQLNRVGPAQALLVPLPPILRQVGEEDGIVEGLEGKASMERSWFFGKRRDAKAVQE